MNSDFEIDSLVSIYIPTKNREALLIRALKSVIDQTYEFIEIIVVDDGSNSSMLTDEVNDLLLSSYKHHFIRFDESKGAPAARNAAINIASGKYITGLDDDDYFAPNRVEVLLKSYKEEFSFVCDNALTYDDCHAVYEELEFGSFDIDRILRNNICNQVFTERKKVVSVGGFDEKLTSNQDYDLWVRLIEKYGSAQKIKDYTYIYDISHDNIRVSTSERAKNGALMFFYKHESKMNNTNKAMQYLRLLKYENKIHIKGWFYIVLFAPKLTSVKSILKSMFNGLFK